MPDPITLPHPEALPKPAPPAQLWGLWCVTREHPKGYWISHIHGGCNRGVAPMTFVAREDAEEAADEEGEGLLFDEDRISVALIGVAPPA